MGFNPRDFWEAAVRAERGMRGSWPIGQDLRVGAFGFLSEDGDFVEEGTLQEKFDIQIETDTEDWADAAAYQTTGTVSAKAFAEGEAEKELGGVVSGKAGVKISFSGQGAVAYRFENVRVEKVRDGLALREAMEELWNTSQLRLGYIVISQIGQAADGFALISTGSKGSATLALDANVKTGPIKIGSIRGGAELAEQSASLLPFVTANPVTPFFHAYKLRRKWPWQGGSATPYEFGHWVEERATEIDIVDTETGEEAASGVVTAAR